MRLEMKAPLAGKRRSKEKVLRTNPRQISKSVKRKDTGRGSLRARRTGER